MSAAPSHRKFVSFDEYVEMAEKSAVKLDYINGRVVNVSELIAMAGGSGEHSLIISNLNREAGNRLKGKPCRVYDSNLRIGPGFGRFICYPDATIICGERTTDPRDKSEQTFTNPIAVFEVLSPSTMEHDFGDKFAELRKIDTLREYVIVHQDRIDVRTFLRQDDGTWKLAFFTDRTGFVPLVSVGVQLSMTEIYDGIVFAAADDTTPPLPA